MNKHSHRLQELRIIPVWTAIAALSLYTLSIWPTYDSRSARRIASLVGPDIVVLDIVNRLAPVLFVIGFLLAWWRITSVQKSDGVDRSDLVGICVELTTVLSGVVIAVILIAVAVHTQNLGLPSVRLLPSLLAVTIGYIGTCIALGAATGTATTRSVLGRIVTMAVLFCSLFLQIISNFVYDLLTEQSLNIFNQPADPILFFFHRLSPFRAYYVLTNWIYGIGNSSSRTRITVQQLQPATDRLVTNSFVAEHTFAGSVPWYLSEWISLITLALWLGTAVGVLYVASDSTTDSVDR